MASKKPRTGKLLNCLHCNTEVYVPKYRIDSFKYCSRSCGAKHQRVKVKKDCEVCGIEFEHISSRSNEAKYCSRKCYYKSRIGKGLTEYECKHCLKKFNAPLSTNRKYCSKKCINKETKKTFKPNYATVRKAMIRRGLINKCNRCGFNSQKSILGVHHIDRNRDNNSLENLEVLCPNCHSIEHDKHICQHS
jgi:hypothetical protein